MKTWVKSCGLTNAPDARFAVECGAAALGFVFHRRSPRFIEPERAAEVINALRSGSFGAVPAEILMVGVWLDESSEQIKTDAEIAGVSCLQTYDVNVAGKLVAAGRAVIFATDPLRPEFEHDIALAGERPGASARAILLDIGRFAVRGDVVKRLIEKWKTLAGRETKKSEISVLNSGISNLESIFPELKSRISILQAQISIAPQQPDSIPPLIMAGGLLPELVFDQIEAFNALRGGDRSGGIRLGIDVASGVEVMAGKKDRDKMRRFFEEVRRWDATAGLAGSADDLSPKR